MKKSNKLSFFYIGSCIGLLLVLIFGGFYGIYISVGLNFVRSSVSNLTDGGGVSNVSYGGTVNFEANMTGVIILSIILVVLAVLDIISLIKQVTLFKQFKMISDSKFVQKIEKKNKSKGAVIFFAVFVDILSLAAGICGIFVNIRSLNGGNYLFLLYIIDALVCVLSVFSIVLLIVKYNKAKKVAKRISTEINEDKQKNDDENEERVKDKKPQDNDFDFSDSLFSGSNDTSEIDRLENRLLKLKYLRSSRLISEDEFLKLRQRFLKIENEEDAEEDEREESGE